MVFRNNILRAYDPKTLNQVLEDMENTDDIIETAIFAFTDTEAGNIATGPKHKKRQQYKPMENLVKTLLPTIKTREWKITCENIEEDIKYFISIKDDVILCVTAEGRANTALLSVEVDRAIRTLTEKCKPAE